MTNHPEDPPDNEPGAMTLEELRRIISVPANSTWTRYWLDWRGHPSSDRPTLMALCAPGLEGEPDAHTELYRWPFSNVYHHFGNALEGVCWPTLGRIELDFSEIPEKAVGGFCEIPNDAAHYTRDLSPNAPVSGYREFLDAIEKGGGLKHDWLEPCAMTIQDLHEQRRRES